MARRRNSRTRTIPVRPRRLASGSGRGVGRDVGDAPHGRFTRRSPITHGARHRSRPLRRHRLAAWTSGAVTDRRCRRASGSAASTLCAQARTPRAASRSCRRLMGRGGAGSIGTKAGSGSVHSPPRHATNETSIPARANRQRPPWTIAVESDPPTIPCRLLPNPGHDEAIWALAVAVKRLGDVIAEAAGPNTLRSVFSRHEDRPDRH